jgi:hypothetical protein
MSLFSALALSVVLLSANAPSEQSAAQWNGRELIYDDGPFTYGFRFRVDAPIRVTSLGVFDRFSNGLFTSHTVALWPVAGGEPLRSIVVPAGTAASLVDRFRYMPIDELLLPAGQEYVVAAADIGDSRDAYAYQAQQFATPPGITWLAPREIYTPDRMLHFPTLEQDFATLGFAGFGANFRFVPVPEPTSMALAAVVLAGHALAGRRRNSDWPES